MRGRGRGGGWGRGGGGEGAYFEDFEIGAAGMVGWWGRGVVVGPFGMMMMMMWFGVGEEPGGEEEGESWGHFVPAAGCDALL